MEKNVTRYEGVFYNRLHTELESDPSPGTALETSLLRRPTTWGNRRCRFRLLESFMKISTDGFIDIRDHRKIRTPGFYEGETDPMPEAEALAFLLSHSYPGHRRIVRPLTPRERRKLKRASWADSVNDRMNLLDQVWRSVTTPVSPPQDSETPKLIQVVRVDGEWAYPIHLDGSETRVLPTGGIPMAELKRKISTPFLDVDCEQATA